MSKKATRAQSNPPTNVAHPDRAHFFTCPHCMQTVDRRDFGAVLLHESPTHRFKHGDRRREMRQEDDAQQALQSVSESAQKIQARVETARPHTPFTPAPATPQRAQPFMPPTPQPSREPASSTSAPAAEQRPQPFTPPKPQPRAERAPSTPPPAAQQRPQPFTPPKPQPRTERAPFTPAPAAQQRAQPFTPRPKPQAEAAPTARMPNPPSARTAAPAARAPEPRSAEPSTPRQAEPAPSAFAPDRLPEPLAAPTAPPRQSEPAPTAPIPDQPPAVPQVPQLQAERAPTAIAPDLAPRRKDVQPSLDFLHGHEREAARRAENLQRQAAPLAPPIVTALPEESAPLPAAPEPSMQVEPPRSKPAGPDLSRFERCLECGGMLDGKELGQVAYHSRLGHPPKSDPNFERLQGRALTAMAEDRI